MAEDPRSRILHAAMRCFASKGYAATTMADIEAAAGFSPRAGGTYRHFDSKRAILESLIESVLEQSDDVLASVPTSLEGAARDGLAQLDRHRDLMQILFRDLDQFPELQKRIVDRLFQGPYRLVAEHTAAVAPDIDAQAVAVLLVGGLINFKLIETMVGRRRRGVSEDRLVKAWAHVYGRLIEPDTR
jgi:AcrR family transcriptional regulator